MKVGSCRVSKDDQDLSLQKDALRAATARGRKGGRPPSMTPEKIRAAADMLKKGDNVSQVARVLNVSRQSIYRNVPMADDRTHRETCRVY